MTHATLTGVGNQDQQQHARTCYDLLALCMVHPVFDVNTIANFDRLQVKIAELLASMPPQSPSQSSPKTSPVATPLVSFPEGSKLGRWTATTSEVQHGTDQTADKDDSDDKRGKKGRPSLMPQRAAPSAPAIPAGSSKDPPTPTNQAEEPDLLNDRTRAAFESARMSPSTVGSTPELQRSNESLFTTEAFERRLGGWAMRWAMLTMAVP